jgi:NAD(P)-dependent dehydrogenase (short-subunit alcohol dehydrogenase family)
MSKPWILICPASRGIGHALTRHLLQTTTLPILVTSRSDPAATKSSLLTKLPSPPSSSSPSPSCNEYEEEDHASRLAVLQLDVTDESSVRAAAERAAQLFPTKTHHLHLGFAIPGVLRPEKSPAQVEYEGALETFKVNTLGPLMLMKHFEEFLPRKTTEMALPSPSPGPSSPPSSASGNKGLLKLPAHATWLTMSARVGSVADNRAGGWYSYRSSKSAVNQLAKTFDHHLRNRGGDNAISFAYHPGTVKTELSEEFWDSVAKDKLFTPEFAARKMCEVVCSRGTGDRGRIWDWDGKEISP